MWDEDEYLHAFLEDPAPESRSWEVAAGSSRSRGPLSGMPFGVKDVIRVDGFSTRAGSLLPADLFAGSQASIVDHLVAAGAVVAGKTVTAEFAIAEPGRTVNPRDPSRTPGGSSSGSAAAVGAGLVPFAIGTQTVGSVIRPAAYCGVVGFRPTWGLVPADGVIPNAPSFDTLGWFTADVTSCITIASVLLPETSPAAVSAALVVGVPSEDYLADADLGARTAFAEHLQALESGGFTLKEVPLPAPMDDLHRHVQTLQRHELAEVHAEWFRDFGHLYRPRTAAAVLEGQRITEQDYQASTRWRSAFLARLADTAADHGISAWVAPAASGLPPEGLLSTGSAVMCAPFSLAGMPAISIPTQPASRGIGHGLQITALPGHDTPLLQLAPAIETALARSAD